MMKNKDKILLRLALISSSREGRPLRRGELAQKLGIDTTNLGVYLNRLIKEGRVEKIQRGEYKITELGKERAKLLQPEGNTKLVIVSQQEENTSTINLEDMDTIIGLKQKYGKKELLRILDKIKKVIE